MSACAAHAIHRYRILVNLFGYVAAVVSVNNVIDCRSLEIFVSPSRSLIAHQTINGGYFLEDIFSVQFLLLCFSSLAKSKANRLLTKTT